MKYPCEDCFQKDPGEWNGCTGEQEDCIEYRRWLLEEKAEYMRSELEAGAIRPGVYLSDFLEATPSPSESGGEDKEDNTTTPTGAGTGCLEKDPTPSGEDEGRGEAASL